MARAFRDLHLLHLHAVGNGAASHPRGFQHLRRYFLHVALAHNSDNSTTVRSSLRLHFSCFGMKSQNSGRSSYSQQPCTRLSRMSLSIPSARLPTSSRREPKRVTRTLLFCFSPSSSRRSFTMWAK